MQDLVNEKGVKTREGYVKEHDRKIQIKECTLAEIEIKMEVYRKVLVKT